MTVSTTRALCRLDDIPDGASRGFGPALGGFTGLFAVRRGDRAFVYVNCCPHVGASLDWAPDRFLTPDGAAIVCAVHGALFGIEDGVCTAGPCVGQGLEVVPSQIVDGMLMVPEDAGL
jgi:nitrite reductase/ring-hydroxylating ferredoxin subunit